MVARAERMAPSGVSVMTTPEYEKPPKSTMQMLVEGCLLLVLGTLIAAAICTLLINLTLSWGKSKPQPKRPVMYSSV